MRLPAWLRPERTVPVTRWRSDRWWTGSPSTLAILVSGLFLFGSGEALLVLSGLGNSPWTVFAEGLSVHTGISIGWATFATGVGVLLLWIPLRQRPGMGTVGNIIVISASLQLVVTVMPAPEPLAARIAFVVAGITLIGIGSGFYLTCNLGPGPRDGWMTGLHHRTGWPVAWVRLSIEVVVLALGLLLGGTAGIGTIAVALFIGPSVAYGLRLAGWLGGTGETVTVESEPELDA